MSTEPLDDFLRRRRRWVVPAIVLAVLYLVTLGVFYAVVRELVVAFETRPRFVVVNGKTLLVARETGFEDATELHTSQAEEAVQTMFNRDPAGLDSEKRLRRLFGFTAFRDFMARVERETPEFAAKSLHQKVEIAEIKVLQVEPRSVRVAVHGQLVRSGSFDGRPLAEARALSVTLDFVHNPSLLENSRYPTVVQGFEIHTQPVSPR